VPLFNPADPLVRRLCDRCGTELAPLALACPSCGALVHRARLKELSDLAAAAGTAGELHRGARALAGGAPARA
jgi:hypothetical protein